MKKKEKLKEIRSTLYEMGISEWVWYNWKTGRTIIPDLYLKTYESFLKENLPEQIKIKYYGNN